MAISLHIYIPVHYYCSLHTDPTLLHIAVNKQQTATFTYHAIAIYVLITNTPLQFYTYTT